MDLELTDEQRLIRETARDFTDKEIVPRARDNDRNEHFDLELICKLAAQGYLGAIVPRDYGGAGLDYLSYGLIVEEVGRGCSAMRTVVSVQTSLVCSAIVRWGTEEQKHEYLPRLCSGEWLGCFALTEPDTGSDAANQRTRAQRTDSGWVINGAKMFISMGDYARLALVFAQTDPEKRHRGIACFLVDTDQPGYQPQPIHHKLGLRGSDTAAISLDDVEVPDERDARGGRRRLQGGDELARLGALQRRRRLRGDLPGVPRRVGALLQGARAVRSADRLVSARPGDARRHRA